MKKSVYFILFAIFVITTSCSLSEFEPVKSSKDDDCIQVVGRVVSFASRDVDTRAGKSFDESATYSMCLARFNSSLICQDVKYSEGSNITFTINKADLTNGDQLYVFANIENPNLGTGKSLNDYLAISTSVQGIDIQELEIDGKDEKCLPMIGSYTIADKENLPSLVPVPLEALFAKVVVTINVTPDQKIDGLDPASFTLDRWEVHNVATTVDFLGGTVGETDDVVDVYDDPFEGQLDPYENNMAQGTNEVSFAFYLPERFLTPDVAAEDFTYPFGRISDLDEDEARRYPQRYKPLLVEERNATFVRFFGEFIDHQTHNYNVSYDIYVGNDNYGNFDIERNKQYNNLVTIRGIKTSSDASTNDQAISIDHRVDVTRVEPIITNLRRETELDSHFEVRPLRIRKNPDYTGKDNNPSVKVEVIYKDQEDLKWIGLERSFGDGENKQTSNIYLVASELEALKQATGVDKLNIAGKRKYFTTDLTKELPNFVEGISVSEEGECVWIYIDEAVEENAADATRSATIRVSYLVNGAVYGDPIDYEIRQHELFPVTFTNGTSSTTDDYNYLIEYHEEYLHNFDADDSYGQTEYEGMKWGLLKKQLSTELDAILISKGSWSSVDTDVKEALQAYTPKYDFYLSRDVDRNKWSFQNDSDYTNLVHDHNGYEFCKNITDQNLVASLTLAEESDSAVEYCYNRNKRNANGKVEEIVWYLPAIDEIEEIVMSNYGSGQYAYSRFPDFRAKMYWSCQPAYLNNFIWVERLLGDRYGNYMIDDVLRARATSVEYNNASGGGPNDPNNYNKVVSGSTGFYKYIDADYSLLGDLSNTDQKDVTGGESFSGSNNAEQKIEHTLTKSAPQAGNLHRENDMARVRCVYKPKN